ncbi:hypothetical protein ACPCTO_35995 [Streptomyces olivoreticuli]
MISEERHRQILRRFATWDVLPKLRARADRRPSHPRQSQVRRRPGQASGGFLAWLDDHNRTLATCRQADIDLWHVEHTEHDRNTVRLFLLGCRTTKLTRRFRLSSPPIRRAAALSQQERLNLLGRLLTNDSLPLRSRVAAVTVLLYAHPCTRVVRLTIDDVVRDDGQALLRLGDPPSPVPGPFAELLLNWIENRDNMNTATNRDSRWLFPGRRAGQPLHPFALSELINDLGVPTTVSRAAAIRQQVLEMPTPVVADALGYHQVTTARLASEAGGTWSRYAPRQPHAVTSRLDSTDNWRQMITRAHQYGPPILSHWTRTGGNDGSHGER